MMTPHPRPGENELGDPRIGAHYGESWASSPAIRKTMQGCRGRDTSSELALRSAVHRLGLRFVVDSRAIPGVRRKADLIFTRQRLAVFMDGCFWHGCPVHYTVPVAHADFWHKKLITNRLRDAETDRRLAQSNWTVRRVWEHEDPVAAAQRVLETVAYLRMTPRPVTTDNTARSLPLASL